MDTGARVGVSGPWRALPTALAATLVIPLAWRGRGSIDIGDWLQYGVALALIVAAALASRGGLQPRRAAVAAVGALAAFALWTGVSAAWSPLPTSGRDEALLALTYAIALALPALTLRSPESRTTALTAVVLLLGAAAALVGAALLWWADPLGAFRGGRLYYPLSYVNAQAALFLVGFWPAIVVASRRTGALLVRAGASGAAAAMAAGWLMTQSRGGAVALVASGAALYAFCPARLRLLAPFLLVGAPVAALSGPLTKAFGLREESAIVDAVHGAARAQLLAAAIATGLGVAYALVDRRLQLPGRVHRVLAYGVLALTVAAVVGAAAAFVVEKGSPIAYVTERWDEFKTQPERETGRTHFQSLGTNRYDFWRVAAGDFAEHPFGGIGARGFSAAYLVERESGETPLRSHSLVMDVLSETGAIGFLLLLLAVGIPLVHAARRLDRVPGSAAFGAGVYWLVHCALDWTWSFPAVAIPAFLLLGIPLGSGRARPLSRRLAAAGVVAALAVALLVLVPPWLSARYTEAALTGRSADADARLAWARRLDGLSVQPLVAEALLARSPAEALPPLERAAEKEPRNVAVVFQLGREYLRAGRRDLARATLERALALHPRSVLIRRFARRAQ